MLVVDPWNCGRLGDGGQEQAGECAENARNEDAAGEEVFDDVGQVNSHGTCVTCRRRKKHLAAAGRRWHR